MKRNILLSLFLLTSASYASDLQQSGQYVRVNLSWINVDGGVYFRHCLEPLFLRQCTNFSLAMQRRTSTEFIVPSCQQEMDDYLRPDYLTILQKLYFNQAAFFAEMKSTVDGLKPKKAKEHYANLILFQKYIGLSNQMVNTNLAAVFKDVVDEHSKSGSDVKANSAKKAKTVDTRSVAIPTNPGEGWKSIRTAGSMPKDYDDIDETQFLI